MEELSQQDNKQEREPVISIKRTSEAPIEFKENPFYDEVFWGRAKSFDDIYLPDSDEALSFAIAAHEIGHLVKDGEILTAALDNFEATQAEEERAWLKGWVYLKKYLPDYYHDDKEAVGQIEEAYLKIKELMMRAVDLSKAMYIEKEKLGKINEKKYEAELRTKRNSLSQTDDGQKILELFKEIKKQKINKKTDWTKFVKIVHQALIEIIKDNKQ